MPNEIDLDELEADLTQVLEQASAYHRRRYDYRCMHGADGDTCTCDAEAESAARIVRAGGSSKALIAHCRDLRQQLDQAHDNLRAVRDALSYDCSDLPHPVALGNRRLWDANMAAHKLCSEMIRGERQADIDAQLSDLRQALDRHKRALEISKMQEAEYVECLRQLGRYRKALHRAMRAINGTMPAATVRADVVRIINGEDES